MVVVATGSAFDDGESLSTIRGTIERLLGDINYIRILRIDENFTHVPVAYNAIVVCRALPGRSAILGAVEAIGSIFGFEDRENSLTARAGSDGDANSSPIPGG